MALLDKLRDWSSFEWLTLAFVLALLALPFLCERRSPESGVAELRIWTAADPEAFRKARKAADEYETAHPGVKIRLDEAAMIDGCTRFQIFRTVVLPLSKPALATLATFTFMGTWGDFMWPMIMTNTAEMRTLPVGLQSFMGQYGAEWPVMMAGAMLMIAPKILVFVFCQRWFVEGIQVGGVKG
jgi:hypothetical protein